MNAPPARRNSRVLVADAVSTRGVELLRETAGFEVDVATGLTPAELKARIGDYDALIVRSATRVTADILESAGRLRVVGRAGTGVDNIDLGAATRAGVVVINTPGGNSTAAAELTISLLLCLARNVVQANSEMRQHRWERKRYAGVEVAGKVLGLVGLGRIGREVARAARGLRMEVWGYDPLVSSQSASDLGIRPAALDELVANADFISLHLPLGGETRHLIDAAAIARMKRGARLINCARGGLVDEAALLAGLESGHLSGAALDVFEAEPPVDWRLVEHPLVVATPHLGASTFEAQERVGTEIAEKIRDYLADGVILDAVNFPSIGREEYAEVAPLMDLAERLGSFIGQISDGGPRRLELHAQGAFSRLTLKPLAMAATKGLLARAVEGGVSFVNAMELAGERGISVEESRSDDESDYAGLLRLVLVTDSGTHRVAGTRVGTAPRLVEVDGVAIESNPSGQLLYLHNRDVPGVVGRLGSMLGKAGVNIAGIHLGRRAAGGDALSILALDGPVPVDTLREIRSIPEITSVHTITI